MIRVPFRKSAKRSPRTRRKPGNFRTGVASTARLLLTPLGKRAARFHRQLDSADRLDAGLIILLPGIDGCTTVSDNIARGLIRADVPHAIQVHDWRSFPGWNPLHLTTHKRNRKASDRIAGSILEYIQNYPDRPIHLIGHSAGAGMALFVLEHLPLGVQVDTVTLLAPAVSRTFDFEDVMQATERGIWSFWSRGDMPTAGLGTMLFGTMDRRHRWSAGAMGFRQDSETTETPDGPRLHQMGYKRRMARFWNFGGHFGCTNTAFVAEYVAPIVTGNSDLEPKASAEVSLRPK